MKFELFIAKRIIFGQTGKQNRAKPLIGTAIVAIALGLTVMILAVAILTGFKKEITDKLIGFSSEIQITNLDNNTSFETEPIKKNDQLEQKLSESEDIAHYHPFAIKAGIVKTKTDLQGVVLKGIDQSFSFEFLQNFLIEGHIPDYSDSIPSMRVVISASLAKMLKLSIGDRLPTYFIQIPTAVRPFEVEGIYNTGLEDYDKRFVFCDIRHIQKVSGWQDDEITGYEILLHDHNKLEVVSEDLFDLTLAMLAKGTGNLDVKTVRELAPGFFDFLKLTDTNVWVILALMVLVSGFNMISALIILILNRTRMIGVLKALGATNRSLRTVFVLQAAYIIGIGLLIGNILGVSLGWIQDTQSLISLNPESYFVDAVPINLKGSHLLLLNLGTLFLTLLMLLIPSSIISRISPAKTIKFD